MPSYWLMKSEPSTYSISDLERDGTTSWEGVRNYQARNFMRDEMKVGDLVLFYHSSADPTGVAGIGRICREAHPDHYAWDRTSPYFDPKASPDNPIWMMVEMAFEERFPAVVTREDLRSSKPLAELMVLRKGMRLSVQPVASRHFQLVREMGRRA